MNNLLEKIKSNYSKNKKPLIVCIVVWLLFSFLLINNYSDNYGKESIGNEKAESLIELDKNTEIIQILEVVDKADSISLCLNDYARKNKGNIYIEVTGNQSNQVYGDIKSGVSDISSDRFNSFQFNNQLNIDQDQEIVIKISSDSENGEAIGLFYSANNEESESTFIENGSIKSGTITSRLMLEIKDLKAFSTWIVVTIELVSLIFIGVIFLFENKKEYLFTSIVLTFGVIMMVVITPLSGPDETYHYEQALKLSNKIMGLDTTIEDRYISYGGYSTNFNVGKAYNRIIEIFDSKMDLENRNKFELAISPVYTYALDYLPSALGITIARLFPLNFIKTYYLGRFFNTLFYALCVFTAIKITPLYKTLFGLVATSCMFIQQSFVYGQDGWICGLSILLFAIFLNWMTRDKKITFAEFLFVFAVNCLLSPAKIVYALLAVLFLLVPNNKFKSKKIRIIYLLLLMIPVLKEVGGNILSRISGPLFNKVLADTYELVSTNIVTVYKEPFSVSYAMNHIPETVMIVLKTIRAYASTWIYGMFGRYLSGLSLVTPLYIVRFSIVLLVLAALQKESVYLSIKTKIVMLVICVVISGLVIASMLFGWTDVSDALIKGIQGRYFSPFLILLLTLLNNKHITIPKKWDKYLIAGQIFVISATLLYVLSYTFVNY